MSLGRLDFLMRDPKEFATHFALDYFHRPRPLRRYRLALSLLFAAACALAVGVTWAIPGGHRAFQSRPVTEPHAPFADNCAACHVGGFQSARRLLPASQDATSTPDGQCRNCHASASHHPNQTRHHDDATGQSAECAHCHREHRGQSLVKLPDAFCTECHADLRTADGTPPRVDAVHSFGGDHPAFKPAADPAGDVFRFNHHKHVVELLEGYAKSVPAERQGELREPLKLLHKQGCQYCHQADTGGRVMKPVSYEAHCRACHPLNVPGVTGAVPHPAKGQTAAVARAVVRERLIQPSTSPANTEAPAWLRREPPGEANPVALADAERHLFQGAGGCQLCHVESARDDGLPRYTVPRPPAPVGGNGRWMPAAKFDHASHAMVRCDECHAAADSRRTADVLMPAIDVCRRCHHDGPTAARSECLTCHNYHARGAVGGASAGGIDDWLKSLRVPRLNRQNVENTSGSRD